MVFFVIVVYLIHASTMCVVELVGFLTVVAYCPEFSWVNFRVILFGLQAFKEMHKGKKPPGVWKTLFEVISNVKSTANASNTSKFMFSFSYS